MEKKEYNEQFFHHIFDSDHDREFRIKPLDSDSLIFDTNREKISLDGEWNYTEDLYDVGIRKRWFLNQTTDKTGRILPVDFSFDEWETMKVPSCWNLEKKELYYYEGTVWFSKRFKWEKKLGERVFVRFGGVAQEARIWLNGTMIGRHIGSYTPFNMEITELLQNENWLFVSVNNERKPHFIPTRNSDWFNYGGIHRSVEIITVPDAFVKDFKINLVPGTDFSQIKVSCETDRASNGGAVLTISELGIVKVIELSEGKGELIFDATPELWSPENPKLYDVTLTFEEDTVKERVGFREIKVEGTEVILNGKKIFLKGVATHEESVENGHSLTEEEIRQNIILAKELGCNFMRLAHYPHNELTAKLADEMGLLLWEEIPVYWAVEFENPETYRLTENQLKELIKRDYNRASVIIWSVANETANTEIRYQFLKKLAEVCRTDDGTRLVSAACLPENGNLNGDMLIPELDIVAFNQYYGWYDGDYSKFGKIMGGFAFEKPVVISEFGGGAVAGFHAESTEIFSEEYMEDIYKRQTELFQLPEAEKVLRGVSPWTLYDFRSPRRRNKYQQGYNRKGLLDETKTKKKKAFGVMQEFYQNWNEA